MPLDCVVPASASADSASSSCIAFSTLSRYPFSYSSSSWAFDLLPPPEEDSFGDSTLGGGGGGGGADCVCAAPDTDAAISGWKVLSRG